MYYTTKGDANNSPDPRRVREGAIIGKVLFSVPYLGYGVAAAQKPSGFLLLVGIPALALIILESQKIVKEIKIYRGKKKTESKESSIAKEDTKNKNIEEDKKS